MNFERKMQELEEEGGAESDEEIRELKRRFLSFNDNDYLNIIYKYDIKLLSMQVEDEAVWAEGDRQEQKHCWDSQVGDKTRTTKNWDINRTTKKANVHKNMFFFQWWPDWHNNHWPVCKSRILISRWSLTIKYYRYGNVGNGILLFRGWSYFFVEY